MDSMTLVMTFPQGLIPAQYLSNLLYKENLNEEESERP